MDRGAWWAAVYGVAQSRTRLTGLSSSSSMLSGWGSANWPIIAEEWWLYTEGEKTKIWLSRIAWGNKTSTSLPLARCACMHTHTHTRYYYHRDQLPKCCYPLSGWCPLELSQGLLLRHQNGLSWWSDDKAVTLTPLFDRILLLSSQVDLERNRVGIKVLVLISELPFLCKSPISREKWICFTHPLSWKYSILPG